MQQPALGGPELALHKELTELAQLVREGADRLSKHDGTVPRSSAKQLEDQLQHYLRKLKSRLNDLQHAANEQDTPEEVQRVAVVAARHTEAVESARRAFQAARIQYDRNVQKHEEQQRRELIGAVDFSQRQQKFAREQDVLEGSQDVTASLRRTRQLMMQNLEQTHGNISVLGSSNTRLQGASDELAGQKALFKDTHKQQRTLQKQSWLDRWAMYIGFAFFLLCVGYISLRRTPAFIKQPVYALLHMKQGGEPFTHQDYATLNVPPGAFVPSTGGAGQGNLPPDWEAWDANFGGISGPADGGGAFHEAEWLDAEQHEPVGRTGGRVWQRGQHGELLEDQEASKQQQGRPNDHWQQQQQQQQQHEAHDHWQQQQQQHGEFGLESGECTAAGHQGHECSADHAAHDDHHQQAAGVGATPAAVPAGEFDSLGMPPGHEPGHHDGWEEHWQQQQGVSQSADEGAIHGHEPELPPPPAPAPVPLNEAPPVDVTAGQQADHRDRTQQQQQQQQQQDGTWQQQAPGTPDAAHHQRAPLPHDYSDQPTQGPEYFDEAGDDAHESHHEPWGLDEDSLPIPAQPHPGHQQHQQRPPPHNAAGIVDPDAAEHAATGGSGGPGQHRPRMGQMGDGPDAADDDPDEVEFWRQQRQEQEQHVAERERVMRERHAAAAAEELEAARAAAKYGRERERQLQWARDREREREMERGREGAAAGVHGARGHDWRPQEWRHREPERSPPQGGSEPPPQQQQQQHEKWAAPAAEHPPQQQQQEEWSAPAAEYVEPGTPPQETNNAHWEAEQQQQQQQQQETALGQQQQEEQQQHESEMAQEVHDDAHVEATQQEQQQEHDDAQFEHAQQQQQHDVHESTESVPAQQRQEPEGPQQEQQQPQGVMRPPLRQPLDGPEGAANHAADSSQQQQQHQQSASVHVDGARPAEDQAKHQEGKSGADGYADEHHEPLMQQQHTEDAAAAAAAAAEEAAVRELQQRFEAGAPQRPAPFHAADAPQQQQQQQEQEPQQQEPSIVHAQQQQDLGASAAATEVETAAAEAVGAAAEAAAAAQQAAHEQAVATGYAAQEPHHEAAADEGHNEAHAAEHDDVVSGPAGGSDAVHAEQDDAAAADQPAAAPAEDHAAAAAAAVPAAGQEAGRQEAPLDQPAPSGQLSPAGGEQQVEDGLPGGSQEQAGDEQQDAAAPEESTGTAHADEEAPSGSLAQPAAAQQHGEQQQHAEAALHDDDEAPAGAAADEHGQAPAAGVDEQPVQAAVDEQQQRLQLLQQQEAAEAAAAAAAAAEQQPRAAEEPPTEEVNPQQQQQQQEQQDEADAAIGQQQPPTLEEELTEEVASRQQQQQREDGLDPTGVPSGADSMRSDETQLEEPAASSGQQQTATAAARDESEQLSSGGSSSSSSSPDQQSTQPAAQDSAASQRQHATPAAADTAMFHFDTAGADAVRAGMQEKQALVRAKMDEQHGRNAAVPAAPRFSPPVEAEDDEGDEAAGGAGAGGLMGLWTSFREKIRLGAGPLMAAAADLPPPEGELPPFKLELRPLEGAEHFFDEPYSDYYFDGSSEDLLGLLDGDLGGEQGVGDGGGKPAHVRPGVAPKSPDGAVGGASVGELYQPYDDDPDDNTDELDYEAAELLLLEGDEDGVDSRDSLQGGSLWVAGEGAVGGQQGVAGGGEQQQQMAGTAELR